MKMEPACPAHITDLKYKITPSEVRDGSRKAGSAPHKTQEKWSFLIGEFLHNVPEPLNKRRICINAWN